VPPWRPGVEAIVAFTGHAVLAVAPDIPDQLLVSLSVDGFGGAHDPRLITALVGPGGWIDSLDTLNGQPRQRPPGRAAAAGRPVSWCWQPSRPAPRPASGRG
jgi:hypothetical protein